MQKQTKTTAAERSTTTTTTTEATSEEPITFTDEPNAVVVRITGKAFANLKEITAIFNRWDEADNTPADIVRQFLCDSDDWLYLDEKDTDATYKPQSLAGMICNAYYDCEEEPQLENAFKAAGFSTQC